MKETTVEIETTPLSLLRSGLGYAAQYGAGVIVAQVVANNVEPDKVYKKVAVAVAVVAISAGLGRVTKEALFTSFDSTVEQIKQLNASINAKR